jgi:hypothetical protein
MRVPENQELIRTILGPFFLALGILFACLNTKAIVDGEYVLGGRVSQAQVGIVRKLTRAAEPTKFWCVVLGIYAIAFPHIGLGGGLCYRYLVKPLYHKKVNSELP